MLRYFNTLPIRTYVAKMAVGRIGQFYRFPDGPRDPYRAAALTAIGAASGEGSWRADGIAPNRRAARMFRTAVRGIFEFAGLPGRPGLTPIKPSEDADFRPNEHHGRSIRAEIHALRGKYALIETVLRDAGYTPLAITDQLIETIREAVDQSRIIFRRGSNPYRTAVAAVLRDMDDPAWWTRPKQLATTV